MTCEDTPVRLTWEIELLEPFSRVWLCRGYGRATTSADPADIARAVLAGYLAGTPARGGETFRAIARTDTGTEAVVTAAELTAGGWEAGPDVRQALPEYLRDALGEAPV
ncbi:hypothetical protein [Streptomyces sp. NPDC008092]|uniref:hypothetical protein n=1 Tax=Streptomyces sp. NPDC008092 TaxID=3364808 RepID=UPI0036E9A681